MKSISIEVKPEYLDKSVCRAEARRLIESGEVERMTEEQLAREISFHALVYYAVGDRPMFRRLKEHANPIDIDSGGDTPLRQGFFTASWAIPQEFMRNLLRKLRDK